MYVVNWYEDGGSRIQESCFAVDEVVDRFVRGSEADAFVEKGKDWAVPVRNDESCLQQLLRGWNQSKLLNDSFHGRYWKVVDWYHSFCSRLRKNVERTSVGETSLNCIFRIEIRRNRSISILPPPPPPPKKQLGRLHRASNQHRTSPLSLLISFRFLLLRQIRYCTSLRFPLLPCSCGDFPLHHLWLRLPASISYDVSITDILYRNVLASFLRPNYLSPLACLRLGTLLLTTTLLVHVSFPRLSSNLFLHTPYTSSCISNMSHRYFYVS